MFRRFGTVHLLILLIYLFIISPYTRGDEFHGPGYICFSPVERSYRFKDSLFIPDKGRFFLGGMSLEQYKGKSMLSLNVWGEGGAFRYYDADNRLRGATVRDILSYVSYGRSLKGQEVYAYLGLGGHFYEMDAVKVENGRRVVEEDNMKHDARPTLAAGLIGGVSRRFGYEYNFCSSKRVRHQLTMAVRLGGDEVIKPTEVEKEKGFEYNRARWYFLLGGGFDERAAYNLFFGFKVDFVNLDTTAKQ